MRGYHFTIWTVGAGTLLGHALICPEARYVAVHWPRARRLYRRHLSPDEWDGVLADARNGFVGGLGRPDCAAARAMAPPEVLGSTTLRLIASVPVGGDSVRRELDAYLWAQEYPGC